MEREEDGLLVSPDHFLRPDTLVVIRKSSRTCCGFLGGDSILFLDTVGDLLATFREEEAHIPYYERDRTGEHSVQRVRREKNGIAAIRYRALFHPFQGLPTGESLSLIPDIIPFIASIPDHLWFAPGRDLFRFSLMPLGTVTGFLSHDFYQERLVACLKWWYLNEAGTSDREKYAGILSLERLVFPADDKMIQKAADLYNKGTYELTGW